MLPLDLQPIPVILDTTFKTPLDCKLIRNAKAGIGHFPLILAIESPQARSEGGRAADDAARGREALLHAGCRIVYGKCADNGEIGRAHV